MKKPSRQAAPDKRAEFLRRQRTQSKGQVEFSNPLPQVMPPMKVMALEDERRDGNLADTLFKKTSRSVKTTRPPMMNLVYPPLKESELTIPGKTPGAHNNGKAAQPGLHGKRTGRIGGKPVDGVDDGLTDQPAPTPLSRSVYVNSGMVMPQPEKHRKSLKQMNLAWRALSLVLAGALGYAVYFMWTSPMFKMLTPVISGNNRVASEEFVKVMGVDGQHSFSIIPAEIQNRLLNTFPELENVDVSFGFPNQMSLSVKEREPVLIWKQGGSTVWIDLFGIPMSPRGQAGNWFVVTAEGSAVGPQVIDPVNQPGVYKPLADPDLILMILNLANLTPAGTTIAYDPRYGLGWNDPAGWKVYFGFNTAGFESKLAQYEGIVINLNNQGIQPKIISVQYPYAPFYRLE